MAADKNKARALELVERVLNSHDGNALVLALRFGDDDQIIDQWLGSNFVEIFAQLGWGFAPIGETASPPG